MEWRDALRHGEEAHRRVAPHLLKVKNCRAGNMEDEVAISISG